MGRFDAAHRRLTRLITTQPRAEAWLIRRARLELTRADGDARRARADLLRATGSLERLPTRGPPPSARRAPARRSPRPPASPGTPVDCGAGRGPGDHARRARLSLPDAATGRARGHVVSFRHVLPGGDHRGGRSRPPGPPAGRRGARSDARCAVGGVRGAGGFPARLRQPLPPGPGAPLPARDPPLPPAADRRAAARRRRSRSTASSTCSSAGSRRRSTPSSTRSTGTARADALGSALAEAYRELAFQTLADQVKRSVRSVDGNRWMFQVERADDVPLRIHEELSDGSRTLVESTPVRMDLTHSGWSDIFFLGMDYPEAARVLNVSIDLGVVGRDAEPTPPIETRLRVTSTPTLALRSIDLDAAAEIKSLDEVFDYGRDYLGLIKAAAISAGLVPPSTEKSDVTLAELLARIVGEGPRSRDHERGPRHPQGLAPRGLHQPAGVAHRAMHAGDRSDRVAHRSASRGRATPDRRARDPRRVARRLGRRLAGLGRAVARHQADRGLPGARGGP